MKIFKGWIITTFLIVVVMLVNYYFFVQLGKPKDYWSSEITEKMVIPGIVICYFLNSYLTLKTSNDAYKVFLSWLLAVVFTALLILGAGLIIFAFHSLSGSSH